jgi:ribonuclease HII
MLPKIKACGIDEVGRGALAGPVVVASVAFYNYSAIPLGIKDSKKVNINKRNLLSKKIKKIAKIGIGVVMPEIIDKIGITKATNLAAQKSLLMNVRLKKIFIDGDIQINSTSEVNNIIKGDANYVSIAAASIIAKVTRDNIMVKKSKEYKNYKWEKNMGYGTKDHLLAIKVYGITNFHRKTFKVKNI